MKITKENQEFMDNWTVYGRNRTFLYAPVAVVEDPALSAQAKILFIIINSYCKKAGICFANNETLSLKLGLKRTMLKKYLKELEQNQLIDIKFPPSHSFQRIMNINFNGLRSRYPKLPIKIPATAKISASAMQKLTRVRH